MIYRINSNFNFIIHYATTLEIAEAVAKDLKCRDACKDPDSIVIEECENANWDPGGALFLNDKKHEFELNGGNLSIFYQHINSFADYIYSTSPRLNYGIDYYKIHSGYMACICVSPEEYDSLKAQLTDPDIVNKASEAYNNLVESVKKAGMVQMSNINSGGFGLQSEPKKPTLH